MPKLYKTLHDQGKVGAWTIQWREYLMETSCVHIINNITGVAFEHEMVENEDLERIIDEFNLVDFDGVHKMAVRLKHSYRLKELACLIDDNDMCRNFLRLSRAMRFSKDYDEENIKLNIKMAARLAG